MLLRGQEPRGWVRTSRLAHVSLESKHEGEGDYRPHLTLRDDTGRELKTWLSKLPAEAVASLLAGIDESARAGGRDRGRDLRPDRRPRAGPPVRARRGGHTVPLR
jgi:hypothetical protein